MSLAPITNGLTEDYRIVLPQSRIPSAWYNVLADMPVPMAPPLHPGTGQPLGPADLAPLFPMGLIEQEVSTQRYIPIPDEVRDIYRLWRPTPLVRVVRLEKALDTPAHIYFKNESISPAGSHKLNTAVPQAYYNKIEGIQSISTETGAGQWGCALAIAGDMFKIDVDVYMVKISYQQKPYRRSVMQAYGATVTPSPSDRTASGRAILAQTRRPPAASAWRFRKRWKWLQRAAAARKYSLGSVLNHVLLHQTVIGQEALDAMAQAGEYPDVVIGCVGGGSNFAGIAFPFLASEPDRRREDHDSWPSNRLPCPTLSQGPYAYDFGDTVGMTPLLKMYTLGHDFRAGADPCRRAALSRHGADHFRAGERWHVEPRRTSRINASRRRSCSRAPRASSPRRRAATPSARRSTRPWTQRPRRKSESSCSTCLATVISTWPHTTPTWLAICRTTDSTRRCSSSLWRRSRRLAELFLDMVCDFADNIGDDVA